MIVFVGVMLSIILAALCVIARQEKTIVALAEEAQTYHRELVELRLIVSIQDNRMRKSGLYQLKRKKGL